MGVDPHERKPVHVMYGFVDPSDRITWFRYVLASGSERDIFSKLEDAEKDFPSRPVVCYMDPNRGAARQKDGSCWRDAFEERGYYVELPDDDVRFGHTQVRNYLATETPMMQWTESCLGKGGPVHAMTRYAWADRARSRIERDAPEKPKDRYKDWPDIIRYVAVARPTFDFLTQASQVIHRLPASYIQRKIRAYA
jgi:hypothetical protein